MDEAHIVAITSWPLLTTVTQVLSFLGLVGFYRRFVWDFNTIAAPLHELTNARVLFHWGLAQQEAFDALKSKLTQAPLLQLLDFDKTFEPECDASDIGIQGVLIQGGNEGLMTIGELTVMYDHAIRLIHGTHHALLLKVA
eukprot:XP_020404472.1 uncharacterized protein LOC109944196 [Zea mays]